MPLFRPTHRCALWRLSKKYCHLILVHLVKLQSNNAAGEFSTA